MIDLAAYIRDVPDFPRTGIIFKDITPLLGNHAALREVVRQLATPFLGLDIKTVAAIESRGFIFGSAVALELGAGLVPLRKPGKLPFKTVQQKYALEYGTDALEIHMDAVRPGDRVLMLDDVLATGGTMAAACDLVSGVGGNIVAISFVVELCFLHGRVKLPGYDVRSLIAVK